ncbi:DUF427 domain-containing protein [Streptomyces sp. NBC_01481]|uniref:DUF427 domain-containing protein n=1 Tax=Streptomyces sp. NBC_01481 TaxID=2975869 RepID=UPI00224E7D0A|nr:DUF427 domain-containing protein [Streptomyces sp. NBC_01481]MCX4586304.1 DUF427 domain-containing protein [Streptomyces sp. NBC_01481]
MATMHEGSEAVPVVRRRPDSIDCVVWEPSERWVRATKGQNTVVDSRRAVLVWEPGRPVPLYAFPAADVRMDLLRRTERPANPRRHAGATVFYDLVLADQTVRTAAWTYPGEELAGYISFEWFGHEVLDHWYEEDEEIFVHPRDPHSRVDTLPSTRHVQVEIEGTVVADTRTPVLLFETHLPVRCYLPREDVRLDLFTPTSTRTRCPYKGVATEYWSWANGADLVPDVAWSYPDPLPSVRIIKDLVAFYNESVDIVIDGERQQRPVTFFSKPSR